MLDNRSAAAHEAQDEEHQRNDEQHRDKGPDGVGAHHASAMQSTE